MHKIFLFASAVVLSSGWVSATAIDLNNKIVQNVKVDPDYRAHGVKLNVTNPDGSGNVEVCWDLLDAPDLKKAMLSVALTALSTGNTVRIWYDDAVPLPWYAPGSCNQVMTITIVK